MQQTQDGEALLAGRYIAKIVRDGVTIDEFEVDNKIVDEGVNNLLNAALRNSGAQAAWYMGVYKGAYTPIATTTAATVAAAAQEAIGYSGGARRPWTAAAAANRQISNSTAPAVFTFTEAATINGAFVVSSSQLNGTGGVLLSIAAFGTSKPVSVGDQLTLTYTLTATSTT